MVSINAGGDIGETINGVCAAIGLASMLRLIAISRVGGIVIGIAYIVNGVGTYFDWWENKVQICHIINLKTMYETN